MADNGRHTIYLISDGTCRTCEQIVQAVLIQFEQPDLRILRNPNVRTVEAAVQLITAAAQEQAVVFYTLVADRVRDALRQAAQEHMVPAVDVLGPVMVALYDLLKSTPRAQPGIPFNRAYVERIDAVEFTLEHDDGRGLHDLAKADVVLVGVSRVSKSTTCFYLAYSGVKAANVPLFADSEPPKELTALDPQRVIGLTMNPHRLQSVRESRMRQWEMDPHDDYGDRSHISRELRAANELIMRNGWRCIDTSYKAIEEIAREVRQLLKDSGIQIVDRQMQADWRVGEEQ